DTAASLTAAIGEIALSQCANVTASVGEHLEEINTHEDYAVTIALSVLSQASEDVVQGRDSILEGIKNTRILLGERARALLSIAELVVQLDEDTAAAAIASLLGDGSEQSGFSLDNIPDLAAATRAARDYPNVARL